MPNRDTITNTITQRVQRFITLYDAEESRLANSELTYRLTASEIRQRATEYALQNVDRI